MNKRKQLMKSIFVAAALAVAAVMTVGHAPLAAAQSTMDEAACIAALQGDGDWFAKQDACRRLRQIGTAKSVPALAALLPDEKLGHMARYALENMPYPEVDQALRDALANTAGMPKAGVIISIGARADAEATPLLVPLLSDADAEIAAAAAGALGRIATPDAVTALLQAKGSAPTDQLNDGLLIAGQRMTQAGANDAAADLFTTLYGADWPMYVRLGALRGLVTAQPGRAPELLLAAIRGDEPTLRDFAAQLVAETSENTAVYADAVADLAPAAKAALVRGLADRGDAAARPAVAAAASSDDADVRLAAVKALGTLGGVEDVPTLVAALPADDETLSAAAAASLVALQADGVDDAMASAHANANTATRAALLEVLTSRRAPQTVSLAMEALNSADADVRASGLRVLGVLGAPEQVPAVTAYLTKNTEPADRAAAEASLTNIAGRYGEPVRAAALGAVAGADPEARILLLRLASRVGGQPALDAVLTAMKDDADEAVRKEALQLLANWPTADAAPHLRALAESEDLSLYMLGLQGYVRLAQEEKAGPKKAELLADATALARRPEELKLVLSGWATLPTPRAINALRPYLDDEAVRSEAALAVISVATELGKGKDEQKAVAKEALQAVLDKCQDAQIRDAAQKALAGIQ